MGPDGQSWTEARWVQLTFEVPREAALSWLPADVTRPVPCYARVFVLKATGAPADGSGMAALLVGARVHSRAVNALAATVGTYASRGDANPNSVISIAVDGNSAAATVVVGTSPFLHLRLGSVAPVDPRLLHWDPWLVSAGNGTNDARLTEVRVDADVRAAWRSKTASLEFGSDVSPASPWRELRNVNAVSACYCEGAFRIASAAAIAGDLSPER